MTTATIKTAATIGRVDECLEVRCPWCGSLDYPEDNTNEIVTCSTCGNEYVIPMNSGGKNVDIQGTANR